MVHSDSSQGWKETRVTNMRSFDFYSTLTGYHYTFYSMSEEAYRIVTRSKANAVGT